MITITINGTEYIFYGDDLTSPASEAIEFLQEQQQQEMVV